MFEASRTINFDFYGFLKCQRIKLRGNILSPKRPSASAIVSQYDTFFTLYIIHAICLYRLEHIIADTLEKLTEREVRRPEPEEVGFRATGLSSVGNIAHDTLTSETLGAPSPRAGSWTEPAAEELQAKYRAIADSVQKVQLPPDCVLPKSAQGITKDTRAAHTIVTKAAKYSETALRMH